MEYLMDEPPIAFQPKLAVLLGNNSDRALIFQQVYYFTNITRNQIDNKNWVYNTFDEWTNHFPWLSKTTIRRHLKYLEDKGLIITNNYNKKGYDKTKWYSVNKEKFQELLDEFNAKNKSLKNVDKTHVSKMDSRINEVTSTSVQNELLENNNNLEKTFENVDKTHVSKMDSRINEVTSTSVQNGQMDVSKMDRPIPDNYQIDTHSIYTPEKKFDDLKNETDEVFEYLNNHPRTVSDFKNTFTLKTIIKSRLKEGITVEELKKVIDYVASWAVNEKAGYFKPNVFLGNSIDDHLNAIREPLKNELEINKEKIKNITFPSGLLSKRN